MSATLDASEDNDGGLNGGSSLRAIYQITGRNADGAGIKQPTSLSSAVMRLEDFAGLSISERPLDDLKNLVVGPNRQQITQSIVLCTQNRTDLPAYLTGPHCYNLVAADAAGVVLYNPWKDNPNSSNEMVYVPWSDVQQCFASWARVV